MTPTVSRPPLKEPTEARVAPATPFDPARRALARAFSSLQYRDFRLLWMGGIVSNVGTLMQAFAVQFLVFEMTKSTLWLGFDAVATWIPMNLLLPFGGVLADRLDPRKVMIVGNLLLGIVAAILGLLYWTGHLSVVHLVIASTINGAVAGLSNPASMTMMPYLVTHRDLPNAVALNSMQYNLSKALGPAIGGAAVIVGATWCFGLNSASFGAVIIATAMIHWRPAPAKKAHDSIVRGIVGGLGYFRSRPDLVMIQLIMIVTSFAVSPLMTMLPAYVDAYGFEKPAAVSVHARGANAGGEGALSLTQTMTRPEPDVPGISKPTHETRTSASALAILMSCYGIGAVAGTAFNASHKHGTPSPWLAFPVLAIMSVLLGVLGFQPPFWIAACLALVCGLCFLVAINRAFAAVLASTPPVLRGRITSILLIAFGIGLPIGAVLAGVVAHNLGIMTVFKVYGVGLFFAITLMFLYLRTRKVKFQADGHMVEPEDLVQASQEGAV